MSGDTQQSGVNVAQLNNYRQWINTHLKKRPGVRLVDNLQTDISNGVALIHLIEVISGHVLADVHLNPKCLAESKENIDKVLKFIQNNSIKMNKTTNKEILEGNIKSIMRLILALAAHFKPSNLQQNPDFQRTATSCSKLPPNRNTMNSNKNYAQSVNNLQALQASSQSIVQNSTRNSLNQTRTLDSMTHLVQAACVSIADVRRYGSGEKNFNVKYVKRNSLNCQTTITPNTSPPKTDDAFIPPMTPPQYNVNNQTYISHTVQRTNFSNESSFTLSPSSQRPLANSTILNTTTTSGTNREINSKKLFEKYFENKNVTRVIKNETDSDYLEKINPVCENETPMPENEPTKKNESKRASIINNHTITISEKKCPVPEDSPLTNQIVNYTDENLEDVQITKNILLSLQQLLMNGNSEEFQEILPSANNENSQNTSVNNSSESDDTNDYALSSLSPEEQVAILRSKIQQLEMTCSDLRNELNQYNYLNMHKVGEGKGLKSRLNEQDNTILEMKTEQLDLHLKSRQLMQEIEEYRGLYQEQMELTKSLRSELMLRNEMIEKFKMEMSEKSQKNNKLNNSFSKSSKENVLAKIVANDVCSSTKNNETFIIKKKHIPASQSHVLVHSETERVIAESIDQWRRNFKSNLVTPTILDILEKEMKNVSEKLIKETISVKINSSDNIPNTNSSKAAGSVCGSSSASISSSTSSSVTSSSANSPVLSLNSISSSTNNSAPNSNTKSFSSVQSQPVRHLSKQTSLQNTQFPSLDKQLVNGQNKHSTESILGLQVQQICGSYDNKATKLSNTFKGNVSLVNNEGHVKKIISRFQQVEQPVKIKNELNDDDDTRPPNSLHKMPINDTEKNSLLTISSSSSTLNDPSTSMHSSSSATSRLESTKCIYYLNKCTQPYCVTIFKSPENILLNDFKQNVKLDPMTNYRFFFKSQEPEFGCLKEEVSNGLKKLPCFDNRIIAWIEELH